MSSTPTPYKPSPLSFNNPRQSPFRRPGSIRAHSPNTLKPITPSTSPLKPKDTPEPVSPGLLRPSSIGLAPQNPPSWLNTRGTANAPEPPRSPIRDVPSPTQPSFASTYQPVRTSNTAAIAARFDGGHESVPFQVEKHIDRPAALFTAGRRSPIPPVERPVDQPAALLSADRESPSALFNGGRKSPSALFNGGRKSPAFPVDVPPTRLATRPAPLSRGISTDAVSRLPPPLLHSMRESFSVLDRDDDGHVNAADVADMLSQLGLSATPSTLATYFNGAQSINLATYLSTISELMSGLSRTNELSAAFEAFDDGDDGQIDLSELKDALLHTLPENGERKLTEREIDIVVDGFNGRRAFGKGGKGLGRGEVFRYQEFMANLRGGSGGENGGAPASG
ncbi:hypothetical protein P153DRAFT_364505 [Dothidotthia symphoricarpi CBS 119687]|uniref:EF-hand domain-containing protein n=1 Tax=Dothidotthia symphoricarpi CBS 119687 TaxID=1392245 RepID=A0A6A6ALL1_9PLEO|nr:uncharacterized protein P153DRAFT_364505 [Dothidotthia symphoricarpi CBS 119687]KAF2132063.1 hypothetical protein P153DRAFT_364505 [Dothidotthia symphoricarpi CBS 119687]